MFKNQKIKTAIWWIIFLIIAVILIVLSIKIKNIEKNIGQWEDSIVNITPNEKKNEIEILQDGIKNIISNSKNSIAAIYAKKTVWTFVDEESWEEKKIETIETLEWNAIVINNDWYLLTNKHVIQDLDKASYTAILQWESYTVDKIWTDDTLDIAVLKIKVKEDSTPMTIASIARQWEIWDVVFAIKNDPEIWEYTTKAGFISSMNKKFKVNNDTYIWLIKNNTAIEAWFSGWPLINIKWEVIWINTAIDNIEYESSFAIPVSYEFVNQTIESIKSNWKIIRPYLWIQYEEDNFYAKITSIDEWSPAANSDLKIWDIIVWIDNKEVKYNNIIYTLYTYKIWQKITINTIKNWNKKDIEITIWKSQ